jgi:VWFA-related protein
MLGGQFDSGLEESMRLVPKLVLVFAIIASGFAQQRSISFLRLGVDIQDQKLKLQPEKSEDRVATLRKMFTDAGCSSRISEQPVPKSQPNLICSTRATSDSTIVIAAPVDYSANKGDEANLRWGDLAMLPILAESLGSVLTRHSFVFVAMTGKSDGQEGAKAYLEHLTPDQLAKVHAVVALDRIGRNPPVYSVPGTSYGKDLHTGLRGGVTAQFEKWSPGEMPITRSIAAAAQRWGFETPAKTDEYGAGLIKPFNKEGIWAITFTSPTWIVTRYIGNQPVRDYRTALDPKIYNQTYLYLCTYLLHLDQDLGKGLLSPSQQAQLGALAAGDQHRQSDENLAAMVASAVPPAGPTATTAKPTSPTPAPNSNVAPVRPVATAATVSPAPSETPVFRTTARLVQVDVVVTDKRGQALAGLTRDDFIILQDGKPQAAHVFEPHIGTPPSPSKADEPMVRQISATEPTYSNLPNTTAEQSRNIILFDMLNTPVADQQLARKQLKHLAQQLTPGHPAALFALTANLVMVEAFTNDPAKVVHAIDALFLQRSPVLTSEAERQRQVGDVTNLVNQSMPSTGGAPGNAVSSSATADFTATSTSELLQQFKTMESMRSDQRIILTLQAFSALARSVAGYAGRKNLIWLSGSFPIRIAPDPSDRDRFRTGREYLSNVSKTVALLTESRVALYPVDIRGMQGRGVDLSLTSSEGDAFVGANGASGASSVDRTSALLQNQANTSLNERESMMEVAEQTGGRAFVNTNDFAGAVARAMDDGSNYYTLAYTPPTKDDKATFHRIEVKLNRPDVKLSYRRGYYSVPEPTTPQSGLAALQGALQPGMPPATMLFFTAALKPPDATHRSVQIHYFVNASNVTLNDADKGGKHVVVDCMAIAFDKEGKQVAKTSDTLDGVIPAGILEATLSHGLPAMQELDLKPGVYNLRLGVQDRASQRIGTLEIPITVQ